MHWGSFLVITSPGWGTSTALSPTADPIFRALMERLNEAPVAPVQPPGLRAYKIAVTSSIHLIDLPNEIPVLHHVMLNSHLQHSQFPGARVPRSYSEFWPAHVVASPTCPPSETYPECGGQTPVCVLAGEYEWVFQTVSELDSATPCAQCCGTPSAH